MKTLTHNQKLALEHLYNGKSFSWPTSPAVKSARSGLVRRGLATKNADGSYSLTEQGCKVGKAYRHYGWNPEIAAFAQDVENTHAELDRVAAGIISHTARMIGVDVHTLGK